MAIDRPPVERALIRTVALAVVALVAVAGLSLALVGFERQAKVGQCINTVLGQRAAPSAADAAAHIKFAKALNDVLSAPEGPQQQAAFATFEQTVDKYSKTLQADQDYRDATPLGKC